jgi:hypothetical protein
MSKRRLLLPLFAGMVAFLAIPAVSTSAAPTAERAKLPVSECSVGNDVCTTVRRKDGRIKFDLATTYPEGFWSFRGNYKLCVHNPVNVKRCRWFKLRRDRKRGIYFDRVDFARNFPSNRPGKYTVIWHKNRHKVNRPLRFEP